MVAIDVVARLSVSFESPHRDWSSLRVLYHPDALLQTVTGGPNPLSRDELIAELERASRDNWYSVKGRDPVAIDEHAVILSGRIRRSVPGGGIEDASHVWLLTVQDGLIYRQGVYGTAEDAAHAYQQFGVSLGIGDVVVTDALSEHDETSPLKSLKPAAGEA
jgi:hypothetical protein